MSEQERKLDELKTNFVKPANRENEHQKQEENLPGLLQKLGNRNIQRLLQRSGDDPQRLDEETTSRINSERGGGAPLENQLQMQMSDRMGFDLSGVRVHDSPGSDQLNQQLSAKAFTTGQDIFFKAGEYNPESTGGKELLAHELTHVVQQGTGQVQNQGGMTVNAPGDSFERQADNVASEVMSPQSSTTTQTQSIAQRNGLSEEDEAAQTKSADKNTNPAGDSIEEDERLLQKQVSSLQKQEPEEEEEVQMKPDKGRDNQGKAE